jgi:hypothetical protein
LPLLGLADAIATVLFLGFGRLSFERVGSRE